MWKSILDTRYSEDGFLNLTALEPSPMTSPMTCRPPVFLSLLHFDLHRYLRGVLSFSVEGSDLGGAGLTLEG